MSALFATAVSHAGIYVAADFNHWSQAWAGLGVHEAPRRAFDDVLAAYSEGHRAYHTRQHLDDCLGLFEDTRSLCEHPHEVAMALWFHDIVYKPRRSDNETASANWLTRVAAGLGVAESSIARMHALVMATRHTASVAGVDAALLVDIDLSILGASDQRFDAYETQVRREYRWVPGPIYQAKRAQILQSFLDRPEIYTTELFHDRFEQAARANILRSLRRHHVRQI